MFFFKFFADQVWNQSDRRLRKLYFTKISLKSSLFASAKYIYHLRMLHTLLPSIFRTGVHPPSPHPKSPMWQRIWVGFELKIIVTTWLWLNIHTETFWIPNQSTLLWLLCCSLQQNPLMIHSSTHEWTQDLEGIPTKMVPCLTWNSIKNWW